MGGDAGDAPARTDLDEAAEHLRLALSVAAQTVDLRAVLAENDRLEDELVDREADAADLSDLLRGMARRAVERRQYVRRHLSPRISELEEALADAHAEIARLRAAADVALDLHREYPEGQTCYDCGLSWPCLTVRALAEAPAPTEGVTWPIADPAAREAATERPDGPRVFICDRVGEHPDDIPCDRCVPKPGSTINAERASAPAPTEDEGGGKR